MSAPPAFGIQILEAQARGIGVHSLARHGPLSRPGMRSFMCASMLNMHIDQMPVDERPRSVIGRAIVDVERLGARGEAEGRVEQWLALPDDEEWALVFGSHATQTPPPQFCTFIGGLPGERIEVEFRWPTPRPGRRRSRRVPEPRVFVRQVLQSSADRVPARCPVFGDCGGCQLQHLPYELQLDWKTQQVAALLRAAGLADVPVQPTLACEDPWRYRNHMRFSVNRQGRVGLTARSSHRVIPLRHCPIAHPLINVVLDALETTQMPGPQVLVRCGVATGQVLVQPVPQSELRARLERTGLDVRTDELTEQLRVAMSAPPSLEVSAQVATYCIKPSSFFQTNTAQANRMAERVLAALPSGPGITLVDAYCGVGTFAVLMAPQAARVVAIEESASAVRDARWNLRAYANVEIVQAKTEAVLPEITEQLDGLVIDPPRAGIGPAVLDALVARRVPRVVYVSCDPATLARDLAYLCVAAASYRVVSVEPIDMFPHTAHIETIVALEAV
jgi:23S rRNA (uracil1939-C5)-methyltransferase